MSIKSFFDRAVVELAAQRMLDQKADSSYLGLSRELKVAIGYAEKTDSQIRAAFKEAAVKVRSA